MSRFRALAVGLALVCAVAARAETPVAGAWRLSAGPDVAGALMLSEDGRFRYWLSAGALDEQAEGRWAIRDGQIRLDTEPRPVPPRFSAAPPSSPETGAFSLRVTWPDGRGIAGVDFRIGFDSGDPLTGYTQEDGWTLPEDETREPRWVELAEPIHGIASPRFPLDPDAGRAMTFILTPNDLGIADFDDALLEREGDRLILHQRLGKLPFVRAGKAGR
jgi:hypothetical protein